jgi:multidrug efflux system membrane fusion protein
MSENTEGSGNTEGPDNTPRPVNAGEPQKTGDPNVAHPPERQRPRRIWPWVLVAIVVAVGIYFLWPKIHPATASPSGKGKDAKSKKGGGGGVPDVVATRARRGDIGIYFTGLGAVTPVYTVTLHSRVDGELLKVSYKEGDLVKKGDLLIEIDPRPYIAALSQAQGDLIRDQALLANARIDLTRYQTLIKTKSIPEQQLATQEALVKQDEGIVKTDEGSVESAQTNVDYTKITAPISGRVGLRLVDPGNIVHASDSNGLLVITQVDPISVLFTVSEDQLPTVVAKVHAGQKLPVDAYDHQGKVKLASGTLTTIDNEIDQTTGTVRLRAVFDNKKEALFPNQFVNARLLVETHRNAVLLSSAGIQRTSTSTFVYLVQPDSTVTIKQVVIGATEGDDSEITNGLNVGDVVVQSGADKLDQGTKVNAQIDGQPLNPQQQSKSGSNETKKSGKKK